MSGPRGFAWLALAGLALPGLVAATSEPAGPEQFFFTGTGTVHVFARYFDGLGSTKFGFAMFGGLDGFTGRVERGSECTEWHGTFTQVEVKARPEDNVADATVALRGFAAAFPPGAAGSAQRFVLDASGTAGAFNGTLAVCDHPGALGSVAFSADLAPLPFTAARASAAVVQLSEVS